ncbi:dUTP diphosphatase [Lysinibacillus xylanilyticus]|uniref:dUTP diphosphatase n=1 Tax=Lysinibacillus xylanilyticus TaxID=582475 RepID=UPI00381836A7
MVDTDRSSILEKELSDFKAQLKDALPFIESLKTENAKLNEQVWGNRLQMLYAKQAELENFIADKHGIDIHEYLNEQQLAILVELAESANEWQGFKYWKLKKDVDREKLLEETVDVLHLILARGIVLGWQVTTVKAYKTTSITMQYKSLMQKIANDEESQKTYSLAFNLYIGLVEMLGFTWQEVETAYAKKHQENIDRQNNDY